MNKRLLKNIEWGILICTILLIVIGFVALFSATQNAGYDEFKKQIMWVLVSIPVMVVVILIDYEIFIKISPVLYGASLIFLIGVLFTEPINGASSWFSIGKFTVQPAEFAKIAFVLFITFVITKMQLKGKDETSRPLKLGLILLVALVPILLIIKQPDYGTALAFIMSLIFMLFVSGIKKRYIITAIATVAILVPVAYFFILPEHAKTRIDVFLNPNLDPRGSGYNVIQSKLAIGSGEFLGMGLLKGNQTQLGFLYPKTTDFIFAVIGEEMGFIIAATVIITYVILITRAIYIAKTAKDSLGAYISMGIAGIFIFHMTENIGMAMGLLPITGVPLPFVSYGGSSLLTNLILIGLLLNISGRRQKAIFVN